MPLPDASFDGTTATSLPEPDLDFSCKGDARVNPEVAVDIKQDNRWIRIPVTSAELWINKDGPSDMTRSAKIRFPFEWGGQSIIQYVNGFDSQNNTSDQETPYDECRIFFYDAEISQWQIAHYGYVGGIGPAADSGVGKLWVYDPADLMKGITVTKSWADPTLQNALNFALRGVDDNGTPVGIESRSVFSGDITARILGQQDIPERKQADVQQELLQEFDVEGSLPVVGSFQIPVTDLVEDIFEWVDNNIADPQLGAQKRFQINRHNMVDHMEWLSSLIDARWWFEPTPDGPLLVLDATAYERGDDQGEYKRRYFIEDGLVGSDDDGLPAQAVTYGVVNTLNNNALVDIKPFNTLYLYGESTTYRERYQASSANFRGLAIETAGLEAARRQNLAEGAAPGVYTEEYPYVKVQYQPLVDRAGGYEYSAQPIESDAVFLKQARNQAIREFRKHLAEQTEGTMEIEGDPHIMPYDYIVTVPACNDTFTNANSPPITWEVNGVKHTRQGGGRYTTELGVSLTVDDSRLDVTAEYRET